MVPYRQIVTMIGYRNNLNPLLWLAIGLLGMTLIPDPGWGSSGRHIGSRQRRARPTPPPKRSPDPAEVEATKRYERRSVLRKTLRIRGFPHGDTVELRGRNLTQHHVTIKLELDPHRQRNLEITGEATLLRVLAPKEICVLTQFSIKELGKPWRYHYNVDLMHGRLRAEHDPTVIYRLPYKDRTRHRVVQGYGGRFSHHGSTHFAVDFAMSVGTTIYAARGGVVAAVKEDSRESGPSRDYLDLANYILIEHSDGTIAEYAHLKYDGVAVEVDEKVEAGQLIGYSGNTGYSKGPHLHFSVRQVTSATESQTVQVKFLTKEGVIDNFQRGESYWAIPLNEKPESNDSE